MKVSILFKDRSELSIENVRKVTNASTRIQEDWLYVYGKWDEEGKPSTRIKISEIICVETVV